MVTEVLAAVTVVVLEKLLKRKKKGEKTVIHQYVKVILRKKSRIDEQ